MRLRYFLVLFAIFVIFSACGKKEDIKSVQYKEEKTLNGIFKAKFEISLENVARPQKAAKLLEKLIYQGKSIDEYAVYAQDNFINTIKSEDFLPITGQDGKEYFNQSYFNEIYKILYHDNSYIIIEYNKYYAFSYAAHGNILTQYLIIDIAQGRILDIDDIAAPLPDDFLAGIIRTNYNMTGEFFRDHIWPPDTINIKRNSVELFWNVYTITPYAYGIIGVSLQDDSFLTPKGKAVKAKIR
jgi:hypothetical protein